MFDHLGDSLMRVTVAVLLMIGVTLTAFAAKPQAAAPAPAAAAAKKTVLITGANRGLGLEFAKQYHAAGWNVIGTAREPDKATDLKALGVKIEALDVADQKSVDAFAARLKDQSIDLLINNAGVSGEGDKLADMPMAEYERVMNVNALGPVRVTKALLPNLKIGSGKTILSISSSLGSIEGAADGGFPAYRESKAALNMFMRSLAGELKGDGFICIPMSPGWVKTDMGGPNATLTPEESISGMRKVIDGLKPEDSGKFWRHDGTIVAW